MSKFCTTCGKAFISGDKFCQQCGAAAVCETTASVTPEPLIQSTQSATAYYPFLRPQNPAKGRIFLLVMGILYVLAGASGIMVALWGLVGGGDITAIFTELFNDLSGLYYDLGINGGFWDSFIPTATTTMWTIYFGFAALVGGFDLFIGIMGITNREKLEKAKFLRTLAIISMVQIAISAVLVALAWGGWFGLAIGFGGMFAFIYPVLYLVGAQQNLKAHQEKQ
ncbi:MAG: zinc ribbon domain-containing protein [Oscillospiraceae bacterium]|nr:zinc ribbon domain-containing protein [Oscillospiraceae bacterium]